MRRKARIGDGTMGRNNRAGNDRDENDGDDLRSENDRLSKLLLQRDDTIFHLNKEIKQLKARLDENEAVKKDAMIGKLNTRVAKLEGDLALAKMLSP